MIISKLQLKQIWEGCTNLLFRFKNIKINRIKKRRLKICRSCEHHSINAKIKTIRIDGHCTICGCNDAAKTACLSCECPMGKWKAENEK